MLADDIFRTWEAMKRGKAAAGYGTRVEYSTAKVSIVLVYAANAFNKEGKHGALTTAV